jgi:hypothetical protein
MRRFRCAIGLWSTGIGERVTDRAVRREGIGRDHVDWGVCKRETGSPREGGLKVAEITEASFI